MLLRNKTKVQRRTRKFEFIEEEKVSNVNPNAKENESPNQNQEPLNKTIVRKGNLFEANEEKLIKEFEKDSKIFFDLRMKCDLDVKTNKCRKCDYKSHSEGLLRLHKERDHQISL